MSGTSSGRDRSEGWLERRLLARVSDPRERAQIRADFEALRRRGGHGRLWYWRELARVSWALRSEPRPRVGSQPRSGSLSTGGALRTWLGSVVADLRHALRVLARSPALALVAVPTVALAVGATTALFSFADALLLRPLPVREPERLQALFHVRTEGPRSYSSFSYPDYLDLRDRTRLADGVAASSPIEVRLGDGPDADEVEGQIVSADWFRVLGVAPLLGRSFLPEEDRTPGTHPVVVIGEGLLERRFGGDHAVVGRTLTIDDRPFTIVGVAPRSTPSIDLGARPELWVPLMMHDVVMPGFHAFGIPLFGNRGTHWLDLVERLAPGVDRAAAASELEAIARGQAEENPETGRGWSIVATAASQARLGPPSGRPLVRLTGLLAAVVGMVLLIACANVANILLARAAERHQEMGVRLSVGASRARLVRQTLTEALLLASLGGVLGLGLAAAGVHLLPSLDAGAGLAGLDVRLDGPVLAFTLAVTVGTGLLFGLVPALRGSAAGVSRSGRRAGDAPGRSVVRQWLVIVQVSLALVLLVGAGLTLRTLWNLGHVPLGFAARDLLLAPVDLASTPLPANRDAEVYERITERLRSVAGVRDVALARISPFSTDRMANDILWEPEGAGGERGRTNVDMNVVDPGYFRTLGIPLLAGRTFTRDDASGSPGVALVNQALADRLWPGRSAVGRTLWSWSADGADVPLQVVGVVANGRYYRSWLDAGRPFLFVPLAQNPSRSMTLHLRYEGPTGALADSVRRAITDAGPGIPTPRVGTAAAAMAGAVALQRTNARLLTLFGALATLIATIGVYGVVSFTVNQRMHEIGVRVALGARPRDVRSMIVAGSGRPLLVGAALGLLVASLLARPLAPLLFGVGPRDPATYGLVVLGVLAAGLAATHGPARRATRVDPLRVFRD